MTLDIFCNATSTDYERCADGPMLPGPIPYLLESNSFTLPIYGWISPVFVLLTLITNCLVCIVLLKKPMRNCTNAILFAMAVSDTMTGLATASMLRVFLHDGAVPRLRSVRLVFRLLLPDRVSTDRLSHGFRLADGRPGRSTVRVRLPPDQLQTTLYRVEHGQTDTARSSYSSRFTSVSILGAELCPGGSPFAARSRRRPIHGLLVRPDAVHRSTPALVLQRVLLVPRRLHPHHSMHRSRYSQLRTDSDHPVGQVETGEPTAQRLSTPQHRDRLRPAGRAHAHERRIYWDASAGKQLHDSDAGHRGRGLPPGRVPPWLSSSSRWSWRTHSA